MTPALGAYIRLVLTSLAWGGSVVAIKLIVFDVPPFTLSLIRYSLAGLLFVGLLISRGARLPRPADLPLFGLAGILGIVVWSSGVNSGLQFTGGGESALVTSLSPFIAASLAAWLLGESFTRFRVVGATISLTGVVLLIVGGPGLSDTGSNRLLGDSLALFAALGWGSYSVVVAILLRRGAKPIEATAYSTIAGAILFIPLIFFEPNRPALTAIPLSGWIGILYLATFSTFGAYLWWNEGVRRIGATRASLFSHLANVNSVVLSALFLGERLAPLQTLGGIAVIAGLVIANRQTRAGD